MPTLLKLDAADNDTAYQNENKNCRRVGVGDCDDYDDDDGLNAVRGIMIALPISLAMWALIIIIVHCLAHGLGFV